MARWCIVFLVISATAVMAAAATIELEARQPLECPPGNPTCNIWQPCEFTGNITMTCLDCHTRVLCTKRGGWVIPCWIPGLKHCVDGWCLPKPSEECDAEQPEPPTEQPTTPLES